MTLAKFPDYMYEIAVNTGEAEIGTFTIDASGEIQYLYATLMIYGVPSITSESVYLRCVRSSFPALPIQSANVLLSSFASGADAWMGKVRFDFAKESLKASDTMQVFLGTNNYTYDIAGVQIAATLNYIDSATGQFSVAPTVGSYLTIFNNR